MLKQNSCLILFTESYPYLFANEEPFLINEIELFSKNFHRVFIIPTQTKGTKIQAESNVIIDESFSTFLQSYTSFGIKKIFLLLCILFKKEFIAETLKNNFWIFNANRIHLTLSRIAGAFIAKKWLNTFIKENKIDLNCTIFYTFWLTYITLGIALLKRERNDIKLISRAHGLDIYKERVKQRYFPCREITLRAINHLFFASDHALKYMANEYPNFSEKFSVSPLGVPDPGFRTRPSQDQTFRIVSCSGLIQLKRIDLIILGLAEIAKQHKNLLIEWSHIGDGILRMELEELCSKVLPKNITWNFIGQLRNKEVIAFYLNNEVDLFITTSEIEGGRPVSIMEAMSCGIPIVGSAVGGIPELINEKNGKLLSKNPTSLEIADVLAQLFYSKDKLLRMRLESYTYWLEHYDSRINSRIFYSTIIKLFSSE